MSESNSSTRFENAQRRTSPLTIALAWLVVSIPAGWGVMQTAKTSAKLFHSPADSAVQIKPGAPAHP